MEQFAEGTLKMSSRLRRILAPGAALRGRIVNHEQMLEQNILDAVHADVSGQYGQPMGVSTSIHHATTVISLQKDRKFLTKFIFLLLSAILLVFQVYTICSIAQNTLYNPCATQTAGAGCRPGLWCTDRLGATPELAAKISKSSGVGRGFGRCIACGGWDSNSVALVPQDEFEAHCIQIIEDCELARLGTNVTCDPIKQTECSACSSELLWVHTDLAKYRTLQEVFRMRMDNMAFHDYFGVLLIALVALLAMLDELHEIRMSEIAMRSALRGLSLSDAWFWLMCLE